MWWLNNPKESILVEWNVDNKRPKEIFSNGWNTCAQVRPGENEVSRRGVFFWNFHRFNSPIWLVLFQTKKGKRKLINALIRRFTGVRGSVKTLIVWIWIKWLNFNQIEWTRISFDSSLNALQNFFWLRLDWITTSV